LSIVGWLLFWLVILAFVAAQGGVIFATAYLSLKLVRNSHWLAKIAAISLSYVTWITVTVVGYFMTGGDGSFMKGFSIVLLVCFTASVGSFGYAMAWLIWPFVRKARLDAKPSAQVGVV